MHRNASCTELYHTIDWTSVTFVVAVVVVVVIVMAVVAVSLRSLIYWWK